MDQNGVLSKETQSFAGIPKADFVVIIHFYFFKYFSKNNQENIYPG